VVCYSRETDQELWRVVFEHRHNRRKVYPDGTEDLLEPVKVIKNGETKLRPNFPKFNELTEVLRLALSKDKA
jgi:hypothetical protein